MKINSITHKLVLTIVVPLIIILMTLGIFNYYDTKKILTQLVETEEHFIQNEIKSFIELQFVAMDIIEEPIQQQMLNYSQQLVNHYYKSVDDIEKADLNKIRAELGMDPKLYDLYVINKQGVVVNTTYEKDYGINFFNFGEVHKNYLLQIFADGLFDSPKFFFENQTKKYKKYSYQATEDKKYIIEIGLYSNQADRIFDYTIDHLKTVEKQRINLSAVDLFFWLDKPTSLNPEIQFFESHMDLLPDLENNEVITQIHPQTKIPYTYLYVKNLNSKLIKGAIVRLAHNPSYQLDYAKKERLKFIIVSLIMLLLIIVIAFLIRPLGRAIKKVTAIAKELSIGNLSVEVKPELLNRNDELGDLSKAIDKLVSGLLHTREFARQTGKENFDKKYELLSENDVLGKTLMKMQARLTQVKSEQELAAAEDQQNKFIADGLAKFGDILRSNNTNIKELSAEIMKGVAEYLNIPVGALFVIEEHDNNSKILDLKATVGYGRLKLVNKQLKIGEGLAGRCAYEKLPIHLKEIPDNYVDISSGMGGASPKYIVLIPLIANEEVFGVIELASFDELENHKLNFVEQLAESIASTLSIAKINQRTVELLEQSKIQKEELAAQEQEMRENMEELLEAQEELENSENDLKELIEKIKDAVFVIEYNNTGEITSINDKYASFLKVPAESLTGKTYIEECGVLGQNSLVLEPMWDKLKAGISQELNSQITINDQDFNLQEYYCPINDQFANEIKKFVKISYVY